MKRLSLGIAGGGLLGRLLAWQLVRAGHAVSVFDVAGGPEYLPRSQVAGAYVPTAAGFTAAGMLSPLAELVNADPRVAVLGWRSLHRWPRILAELPDRPAFSRQGSLLLAHGPDLGAAQRVLARMQAAMRSDAWREHGPSEQIQLLQPEQLGRLEPTIHGAAHAWLLPREGHIDTVGTMMALYRAAPSARLHWREKVVSCGATAGRGWLLLDGGERPTFDGVLDVRGAGARPDAPVRGVRGEIVWLDCPGHGLTRPLRLMHPRQHVYLVPRSERVVLVGASEIESEDRSPVSLRTAVELMAAAHSVLPALAEARILRLDVNLRPAMSDNNPLLESEPGFVRINGLFRHGWLLAPALVEQAFERTGWCGALESSVGMEPEMQS